MAVKQELYHQLVDFIIDEYWGKREKITLETKIEHDLGITGDDGVEFLEKFLSHFNIDYDENREWQPYFEAEASGLINFVAIYNRLMGKKAKASPKYDLTLKHLLKVIELGYWVDMGEN